MTSIGPMLARLGLSEYTATFIAEGFELWETVLYITESDLDSLKVKLGHRRKLQSEIAKARGIAIGQVVPSALLATAVTEAFQGPEDVTTRGRANSNKQTPSASGKRKYRRHPKPDENAPERPPSAYVIFSNRIREELKPQNLSFTEIAKRVGERWQLLTPKEKEVYESDAGSLKERYNMEFAKYKRTASYREYQQYLTEFKAKTAAANNEPKRPRLETRNSEERSSLSAESRQEHTSPNLEHMTPMASSAKASSSASLSPVAFSPYAESSASQAMNLSSRYSPTEGSPRWGSEISATPQLPRIAPLDDRDMMMKQPGLPPLMTDLAPRVSGIPSMHHRSDRAPASFLRKDTQPSSLSSRSSNLSSGAATGSSSSFTPVTPIEESRMQRVLPPPLPLTGGVSSISSSGEAIHSGAFPILPAISQGPQGYPPKSTLSNDSNVPSTADIPLERRSFLNLSLASSSTDLRPSPRSRTFDRREVELPLERRLQHSVTAPTPYERTPSTPSQESKSFTSQEEDDNAEFATHPTQLDGLSALALAGRIVDRNARKPP